MKKSVEFKLCGKEVKLEFNIMRLAKFEKALGQSLFYIMSTNGILRSMDINFTIAGLAFGLEKELTLEEAADTIQKHCDQGGILDDINDAIYRGIIASGLFIKAAQKEAAEE